MSTESELQAQLDEARRYVKLLFPVYHTWWHEVGALDPDMAVILVNEINLPHPSGVGEHWAPHCDNAVLHAPGECWACDLYPAWQRYRQVAGIAFTGKEPTQDETMCPSEVRRPVETINRWGGNQAHKERGNG